MPGATDLTPVRVLRQYVWNEPAAVAPAGPATTRVVRGQVHVALAGSALWVLGLVPGLLEWPGPVHWCVVAFVVAWVFTAIRIPREPVVLVVVMVVAAVVILFTTQAQEAGSPLAAGWFDAVAITFIGMATLRRALVGIGITVAAAVLAWLSLLLISDGLEGDWRSVIVWPMATLSLGLTGSMMAAIVRAGARRLDGIAESAQRAVTADDVVRSERQQYRNRARLLHDTVINTLAALGRGVPPGRDEAVRLRCRQDLGLIDRLVPGEQLRDPVTTARARAAGLGLTLTVVGAPEALTSVDDAVGIAAGEAIGEALLNIEKHAGVTGAMLSVAPDGPTRVSVTVSDKGRGWDGEASVGGGIAQSIQARCEAVGIDVDVVTAPGDGTTVRLLLPVTQPEASRRVFFDESLIMTALVCGILLVDLGVRSLLTFGVVPDAWRSLVAFGLLALTMAWPWATRGIWLRPTPVAALALSLVSFPVVLLLPDAAGPISWVWWGSAAGIVVFLALVSMTASAWWVLIAYLAQIAGRWVAAQEGLSQLFPDSVVLGLGALTAILIRRRVLNLMSDADRLARDRDRLRDTLVRDAAEHQESLRRLRSATDAARVPLELVASGAVPADDPAIRDQSARLAQHLRNVSRVDPGLGDLGLRILDLLDVALAHNTTVSLNLDPRVRLPRGLVQRLALEQVVADLAAQCAPDAELSLTVLGAPGGGLMAVVAPSAPVAPMRVPSGLSVATAPDDPTWVEVSWGDDDRPTPARRGSMVTAQE